MTRLLCVVGVVLSVARLSLSQTQPIALPEAFAMSPGTGSTTELLQSARDLIRKYPPKDDVKAQIDQLLSETVTIPPGEGRRRAAHAITLAQGGHWDARHEFFWSLAIRPERFIADPSHPTLLWLCQLYSAPYVPSGPVKLTVSLFPQDGKQGQSKGFGDFNVVVRDLVESPFPIAIDMKGIADGGYELLATFRDGGASCALSKPIRLANGIDSNVAAVERRLARIEGHEGTKASIRYPYDLARVFNTGQRNYNNFDLGLGVSGGPNEPDFAAMMKRSDELLTALEAGNDPLYRAKGDVKRHYWFPETGEILPYHLYVPTTWDGKTPLPTILILHGNTRDQDFYFEREDRLIPKLAEKHGYMLIGVLGYHPNGGYNAGMLARGATTVPARGAARAGNAARGFALRGGAEQFANSMSRARIGQLSEADTIDVFNLVKAEYPTDPKRTYLFGYSAGGAGAYYMGPKYAENWAAVATGGGTVSSNGYPFDRLKDFNIPVHIFYGEQDSAGVHNASQTMARTMKEHGIEVDLIEYKGANHDTAPGAAVAHVFDFFDAHRR